MESDVAAVALALVSEDGRRDAAKADDFQAVSAKNASSGSVQEVPFWRGVCAVLMAPLFIVTSQ